MTKTKAIILCIVSALLASVAVAVADYSYTQGSGTTVFAYTCFSTKVCPTQVISNSSGTEVGTASNQFQVGSPASGFADGWNVTEGTKADAAYTSGSGSMVSVLKGIYTGVTAALPAGTNVVGYNSNDPCGQAAKTNVAISTATGTTALVTGVSAKKVYVCSLSLIAPSAVSVSLAEGSSSSCGTSNQAAVIGVATNGTAANGMALAANGGLTLGNGAGTVAVTATAANYLCLFQSGTAQLAGNLTYVQQ